MRLSKYIQDVTHCPSIGRFSALAALKKLIEEGIIIREGFGFIAFGYEFYFQKKYNLINGFEEDYKAGRKTELYAKRVGLVELIIGIILILFGICVTIIK